MHRVEVWRVRLDDAPSFAPSHWASLDQFERQRALRFHHDADRARFVVARATLRALVGLFCGLNPAEVRFRTNPFGKLELPSPGALHFNTGHSGRWVLHAFSTTGPVGIDVEAVTAHAGDDAMPASVLAPAERAWLLSLAPPLRPAAFTGLWVRKEAYVKALGEGLSRPLNPLCALPAEDGAPQRLWEHDREVPPEKLSLHPIELDAGYAACLAYLGPAPTVQVLDYGLPPGRTPEA